MKTPLTNDETTEALKDHLGFLLSSCRAFDDGNASEAKRIAASLRVLLHQTPNSHALLGQVGLLNRLYVLDSAGEVTSDLRQPPFTLTGLHIEVIGNHEAFKNSFIPKLGQPEPPQPDIRYQIHELLNGRKAPRSPGMHLPFDQWWNQTVINAPAGHQFSRKKLILTTANQEGAHVDPGVDDDYYALTRLNSLGVYAGGDKENLRLMWASADGKFAEAPEIELTSAGSPVPASLRQIAWELTQSLIGQHPEFMP
ncbi:hypothetical protein [Sinomonas sp. ASV322]|uniref:hypothetical protein n=1 Tax=Sinomonas sp. ASV322 TaxID=3041920 RepID=UPI0027DE4BC4|nr:hypothetical protein [Sinomonas sp. ASV322]MDQ4502170.1 hypothetical protein [Sinomonas sp. ASV322]